ncbi:L,D-transpeptidase family protein [Rhodobacter ferrooxidans]|uniref:Peptidoglycan-binding domain 1 protein n=1 Tax=Rhodobacter ferrooxidans TaxID=371731 RepID=C8RZ77_9RHOB|nr:L,D-transpeptidase family protein [Rhodobacter sp. SW2]EEW26034.1 Peptidoglycan-binding domain 1 protein [Rhodobacter sp. SW2]
MTKPFRRPLAVLAALMLMWLGFAAPAQAQLAPFTQAVAEAAASDEVIASYYRDRSYSTLFTGPQDEVRRHALLSALALAGTHGLPVQRYDAAALTAAYRAALTEGDRGRLEVRMTKALLDYARDLQTGALVPSEIDPGIKREVPVHDRHANLVAFETGNPVAFLRGLAPTATAYPQLMKAKLDLEAQIASGGWGAAVPSGALKPGQDGPAVVALRDRLIRMGYLHRTATAIYDADMQKAVQAFQLAHGLTADGVAGTGTIEQINIGPEARWQSVVVAMERERWMNIDRGHRHIWVNLTDFTAKIIDDGKVTFTSRSVIGKNAADRRSPEFSDMMEFMVINPSWSVPRSITTREYLPMMQRNPNAAGHLKLIDRAGRVVSRASVDFTRYTAANFPFAMRQAPSSGNALGLVKFMFPNPYNIYLHDTPSKSLFANEVRDFSHGCIRLGSPFDFAYALLARQTDDPKGLFEQHLNGGGESRLDLAAPVPVHLVYFTAFPGAKGQMNYRRDVYGRDALIFDALSEAGVVLGGVQG